MEFTLEQLRQLKKSWLSQHREYVKTTVAPMVKTLGQPVTVNHRQYSRWESNGLKIHYGEWCGNYIPSIERNDTRFCVVAEFNGDVVVRLTWHAFTVASDDDNVIVPGTWMDIIQFHRSEYEYVAVDNNSRIRESERKRLMEELLLDRDYVHAPIVDEMAMA